MAGPNLEVFKFGLYILFPIGWMYYFGTNLDNKFSVTGFWPSEEQTHKIPFERDEINKELEILKQKRLARREKRLAEESGEDQNTLAAQNSASGSGDVGHRVGTLKVLEEVRQRQEGWRD